VAGVLVVGLPARVITRRAVVWFSGFALAPAGGAGPVRCCGGRRQGVGWGYAARLGVLLGASCWGRLGLGWGRVLGGWVASWSSRAGVAAGGRQRGCPLDDQAAAGVGSEDFFGFAMSPYTRAMYRGHGNARFGRAGNRMGAARLK
jgi:hypothetical protein